MKKVLFSLMMIFVAGAMTNSAVAQQEVAKDGAKLEFQKETQNRKFWHEKILLTETSKFKD